MTAPTRAGLASLRKTAELAARYRAQRDAMIVELQDRGFAGKVVAEAAGVSQPRVVQIRKAVQRQAEVAAREARSKVRRTRAAQRRAAAKAS
jgi:hypothetical protein